MLPHKHHGLDLPLTPRPMHRLRALLEKRILGQLCHRVPLLKFSQCKLQKLRPIDIPITVGVHFHENQLNLPLRHILSENLLHRLLKLVDVQAWLIVRVRLLEDDFQSLQSILVHAAGSVVADRLFALLLAAHRAGTRTVQIVVFVGLEDLFVAELQLIIEGHFFAGQIR